MDTIERRLADLGYTLPPTFVFPKRNRRGCVRSGNILYVSGHGLNLPPYDLPGEKTKSTIKSNSTKDGGGNANEIRFEDLKGSEEFFTHAAKDQNEIVENDMSTEVKRHQMIKVEQNRSLTVISGNETVAIQSGSREVSVQSNEKHINSANFDQKVSANYTLKVNGNITIDASGLVTITGAKIILNG